MKKFLCFVITMFVLTSMIASAVGAVSYADLRPTYAPSGDYTDYVNTGVDDRLELRSNCYGYVMRLHYGEEEFSVNEPYGYFQFPGEFYNKYGIGMTYSDLNNYYEQDYNNDGKFFDWQTVYRFITYDCAELGYSVTTVNHYGATESFVPPSASSDANERLIAFVEDSSGSDFHFYMQNSDDIWSHKPGNCEATTKCIQHNTVLNNSNISQHIHCNTSLNNEQTLEYTGNVLLFRISAPGSSDRYHYNGHNDNIYFTATSLLGVAGDYIFSAFPIQNASVINTIGRIEYIDDIDYYMFNVTESGSYRFNFQKSTYAYRVLVGEVVDGFSVSGTTTHSLSASAVSASFVKTFEVGKMYYIRVVAYGQEDFDSSIRYTIGLSLIE